MTAYDILRKIQGAGEEACGTVCSSEVLRLSLQKERARSNRSREGFSFVLFEMKAARGDGDIPAGFVRTLSERVRAIDTVGWMSRTSLGVILPSTPPAGAKTLADEMLRHHNSGDGVISYTIYTYPFTVAAGNKRKETEDQE